MLSMRKVLIRRRVWLILEQCVGFEKEETKQNVCALSWCIFIGDVILVFRYRRCNMRDRGPFNLLSNHSH